MNPILTRSFLARRAGILLLICGVVFFFGNNLVSLTDPDEVFYALTAKEMLSRHQWVVPYIFGHPQFEKPILTYWLIELAFQWWGISAAAARFFPAVFACLGVLGVYGLGLLGFRDERKAFLSAVVLASSAFFVAMGKTVFTDTVFSVFILYALLSAFYALSDVRRWTVGLLGFYVFCALATLTKGPLGLLIPGSTVVLFLCYQRELQVFRRPLVWMGLAVYLAVALPWYGDIFHQYGRVFTHEFFYNDHWRRLITAEHHGNDRWYFYPVTMLAGLFPWTLFLAAATVGLFKRLRGHAHRMDHWLLSWILVVFVIFQIAHSKLASYVLPVFPALALLTGDFLGRMLDTSMQKLTKWLWASFSILALLGVAIIAAHKAYSHYISSWWPEYFLSAALIALAGIGASLTNRGKIQPGLYVLSLALCPVFLTFFLLRLDLEGYISSYEASQYIPQNAPGRTMTVLTEKANARGIRYYTGQDVAVVDFGGNPFFSPHPIPILKSGRMIDHLLESQPVTMAVVHKSIYHYMLKHDIKRFHMVLLAKLGYDYILRIEPLKPS